jgi:hypothetical protein
MSLSDKLSNASKVSTTRLCKIGLIISSDSLPKEDRENLKAVLEVPEMDPSRIPNVQIGRILREEGYDISNSAVDRHRRGECPCKRVAR